MVRNYNYIIVVLLITSACSLYAFLNGAMNKDTVRVEDFPTHIAGWVSENIPISPNDLVILETDNAFVRKYKNATGEVVYLYIVYAQQNRKVVHPPEICYTGGGINIISKQTVVINVSQQRFSTNLMSLEGNSFKQMVFYWFKAGDVFTGNYLYQQLLTVGHKLFGKRQGSALIRVAVDVEGQGHTQAKQLALDFIKDLTPTLKQHLP